MPIINPVSTTPLYADNLSSITATFNNGNASLNLSPTLVQLTDQTTFVTMNLSASAINFSDESGQSSLTTTSLNMSTVGGGSFQLSGVDSSFILTSPGSFNLSVGKLQLNGVDAPSTSGQSLIANDASGGLQWFTITDLLNLEAGIYTNLTNDTTANIQFAKPYNTVPAVVITPDSDAKGQIIPVSLNGVSVNNFSVIFGSNKLKKF
jgi:archaellin